MYLKSLMNIFIKIFKKKCERTIFISFQNNIHYLQHTLKSFGAVMSHIVEFSTHMHCVERWFPTFISEQLTFKLKDLFNMRVYLISVFNFCMTSISYGYSVL